VSGKNDEAERLQRYEQVVAVVAAQAEFSLSEVKRACFATTAADGKTYQVVKPRNPRRKKKGGWK
jgi:hypothetical protein